jgi:hypothetical protein
VKVKGKGGEYWLAAPSMNALPGETYRYQGGMMMKDFHSRELDRTFDEILFVDVLFGEDETGMALGQGMMTEQGMMTGHGMPPGSVVMEQKSDVTVDRVEGTVTISELFADPGSFEGRSIRVRGEVVKFNPAIMERNWVHLQDGTEHQGKFDLTATTRESFQVGSVVTLEGIIALNLDFGYGYTYEILLEEATAVE